MAKNYVPENTKVYLVGGGIGSLAAAAFSIRDGHIPGKNITVFEEMGIEGGSMDGAGEAQKGYVIRGGRMLNDETFECLWDLLRTIPSLNDPDVAVRDEIIEFNHRIKTHAQARLVNREGKVLDVSSMGFSMMDRINLLKLIFFPEAMIGVARINEWFAPDFFESNFWYMWATTFAFQPWHSAVELKRYMIRFMHEFPRIHTLAGVWRTPYNQYDSIILPLTKWLKAQGVKFEYGCQVTDVDIQYTEDEKTVEAIHFLQDGKAGKVVVNKTDLVCITNGSMTESSSLGSMHSAPKLGGKGSCWTLWEKIAQDRPAFGNPSTFDDHIDESLWESFTVTLHDPTFFQLMEKFTRNSPGTGALVTFKDSNWLMSVVLAYQPHFINQPKDVQVFWGYGLFPNNTGDYVKKKMSECTGEEIMIELLNHLKFTEHQDVIMKSANCIPCMMPFITAQFLKRAIGDRPDVVPAGSTNLAFLGQFAEIPNDVVFTVEYSVRSAMTAIYSLLKLDKEVIPIYEGQNDARILFNSFVTSFR